MAITLTKKFTGTWANGNPPITEEELLDPLLVSLVPVAGSISGITRPFIADMVAQGKTDGQYYFISDTSSYRLWTDQASVLAFRDLVVNAAAGVGRTDFSYTITDI